MSEESDALAIVVSLPLPLLAGGCAATAAMVGRARATVGAVIAAERPWSLQRKTILLGLHLGVLALVLAGGVLPLAPTLLALGLGAAIVALAPGFHDAVCGENGVQRGWHARRWADLEEWRLSGEHLRFRLFGEWTSVPLPAREQPRVREKLLAICADRESRFNE